MKKFIAILLAVLTVLASASMMVYAVDETFDALCPYCDFARKGTKDDVYNAIMNHMYAEHSTKAIYICFECCATYDTREGLSDHYAKIHKANQLYICDFCGWSYANTADLNTHLQVTYPVKFHTQFCDNAGKGCVETFHTREAYTQHMRACPFNEFKCGNKVDIDGNGSYNDACDKVCEYYTNDDVQLAAHRAACTVVDNRSDFEQMCDYFRYGNIIGGLKKLVKIIVDFVKGDTFKKLVEKVGSFIKGINLDKVVSSVKDIASKIPFDKVKDIFKK